MKNKLKIAVTGGIGSGKSQVLTLLKEKGYPVFSCDQINAELLTDENYLKKLNHLFPNCFVGGILDKQLLSAEVFSSLEKRKALENLAHPAILQELISRMEESETTCFCEVPLLLEQNLSHLFDKIVVVFRSAEDRVLSITQRDNCSKDSAMQKIAAQFPYDSALSEGFFSDEKFILLKNDSDVENLKIKIEGLLKTI